jgi:hypothetical protein
LLVVEGRSGCRFGVLCEWDSGLWARCVVGSREIVYFWDVYLGIPREYSEKGSVSCKMLRKARKEYVGMSLSFSRSRRFV